MDYNVIIITLLISGVQSSLRFSNSYSDHMVLQRAPERAILWGYADVIDDVVSVWMDGFLVAETNVYNETSDDSTGIWTVKLPAENDPGPHEILVNSSEGNVHLYDVLFGDVWLCSGQSNMQFSMSMVNNSEYEITHSLQYKNIRMLTTKQVPSSSAREDVEVLHPWIYPIKGIIDDFSALCFMFARDLQDHIDYPIGLIDSSWGGTPIEAWSSNSAIEKCPAKIKHPRWRRQSLLWNSMIYPYTLMTIKGAIWYQGEGNRNNAGVYACQFRAMINDWRKHFNKRSDGETSVNFPFGFVQLAPFRKSNTIGGFPKIRWAQTTNIGYVPNRNMPNTFMAVAIDLPDFWSPSGSIHPRHKQDIAARLVLGAKHLIYGDEVVYQGPFPTGYRISPHRQTMLITLNNDKKSLQVNHKDGFEICCASAAVDCLEESPWYTVDIVRYRKSTVEIDIGDCYIQHVLGVRYLWRESPCAFKHCALYDSQTQLPVPPFRKIFGMDETSVMK
ncbi:sialate O-acetylesterase-like [Ruditapes philippinarum]|uniref:sialate O-acetylesterase-like n=1 Tax=Ruditapes philippinarum TaxID=129788 RepID=UPI00295BDED1|nr:sialate O-acetylesterase-like [Ruditapes philippinarum]